MTEQEIQEMLGKSCDFQLRVPSVASRDVSRTSGHFTSNVGALFSRDARLLFRLRCISDLFL